MRRVVFLINQPLDHRNFERFGLQTWMDRGWKVEVWDFTPRLFPEVWQNFFATGHKIREFEGYFPIARKSDLSVHYARLGKIDCFFDDFGDEYFQMRIKRHFIRSGAMRIVKVWRTTPTLDEAKYVGLFSRVKKVLRSGPRGSARWLATTMSRKLWGPWVRPGLVIVSGELSIRSTPPPQRHSILRAHSYDYDQYLKLARSDRQTSAPYAVFIDQDCCFHSDFFYLKIPHYVTPDRYFPPICRGLRKISTVLNREVIVAAHPRSSYGEKPVDYFQGLHIEYGKTGRLIKNATLVVAHNSTAIDLAVLFSKPIIFVTTDQLAGTRGGAYVRKYASVLGKSPINLDGDLEAVDWKQQSSAIDTQKYAEYRREYIKTDGSPELPFWEIVINHLETLRR